MRQMVTVRHVQINIIYLFINLLNNRCLFLPSGMQQLPEINSKPGFSFTADHHRIRDTKSNK
jgi:hypothetical protein